MGLELHRLSNGVRVALDPMPDLQTVALGVWQRVGARHEAAAENGVAHLFEHMAFKGAGQRDARAFAEAIEAVGGMINAATSYERTSYYARMLAEHAPLALDLIADILRSPHWTPDELEKEKGVIEQERGEAFDAADDRVFELHQAVLFPDQPLGRPVLGEAETLSGVSIETLSAFRDAHMTPSNLVVSVAGAFDRQAVLDRVEARFGDLAPACAPAAAPARPMGGAAVEARKLEQAHLAMSWSAPPAGDERVYAYRLMTEIFGGGISSRLFQEVREARGLVYAIDAFMDAYEDVGRLCVYAGCAAKNAAPVTGLICDVLEKIAKEGVTAAELARAKAVASGQLLMGAESPAARAEARAAQVFLRDRLISFTELRGRMLAVTADEVQAAAKESLEGVRCIAVLGPRPGLGAADIFRTR